MKIIKILKVSLSTLLFFSCFNVFGGKKFVDKGKVRKFKCLNCKKKSAFTAFNVPFRNCNLRKKYLCRTCFYKFNELNGAHLFAANVPNQESLSKILTCAFCNKDNNTIKELFNSNLSFRVKSFIYKVAKYHDKKNNTSIVSKLYEANRTYFDNLNKISLFSDNSVELSSIDSLFTISDSKKEDDDTCVICYETTNNLNGEKICANNHGRFICKFCLGKIVTSNNSCPICKGKLNVPPPLPDNFHF